MISQRGEQQHESLTISQMSRILGVSVREIGRWVRDGHVESWSMPNSGHARVTRRNFGKFLRDRRIIIPGWTSRREVLLVGCERPVADSLETRFPATHGEWAWVRADTLLEAGYLLCRLDLDCVVIDFALGRTLALDAVTSLTRHRGLSHVRWVAVAGDDEPSLTQLHRAGFRGVVQRPYSTDELARCVAGLLDDRAEK